MRSIIRVKVEGETHYFDSGVIYDYGIHLNQGKHIYAIIMNGTMTKHTPFGKRTHKVKEIYIDPIP